MSNDILESVSQRGYGAYDAENRRIKEISDELQRLCRLHEAQPRTGQEDRGRFEIEQKNNEGRYTNGTYLVWDVVPRNVLVDADGDMYVVDAEIKGL